MKSYQRSMKVNEDKKKYVDTDKWQVYFAVEKLQPIRINKITKFLNEKKNQEIENEVEKLIYSGKINSDKESREKKIRNLQIQRLRDKRTYQRRADELLDQGYLNRDNNNYYTVSNIKYPKVKLKAEEFGNATLFSIMKQIFPHQSTLENNLQKLVEIFGVYIVYCFIEAIRPLTDENNTPIKNEKNKEVSSSRKEKDELVISWIKNVVNIEEMFYYFISLLYNQIDDEEVGKNNSNKLWKNKKAKLIPTSYLFNSHNYLPTFRLNIDYTLLLSKAERERSKNSDNIKNESYYEFESDQINILKNILKNKFESQYDELEDAFRHFTLNNKEGIKVNLPPLEKPEGYDIEKLSRYFPYLSSDIIREYLKNPVKFINRLENCSHDYRVITIKDDSLGEIRYYKENRCRLCNHIEFPK